MGPVFPQGLLLCWKPLPLVVGSEGVAPVPLPATHFQAPTTGFTLLGSKRNHFPPITTLDPALHQQPVTLLCVGGGAHILKPWYSGLHNAVRGKRKVVFL